MSEPPPPQPDPNLDPTGGSARDFGKGVLIVLVLVGLAYLAMMFQLAGPPGGPPPPGPPPQAGPPPAAAPTTTTQAPPSTPMPSPPPAAAKGPSEPPPMALQPGQIMLSVPIESKTKPEFLQEINPAPGVTIKLFRYPGFRFRIQAGGATVEEDVVVDEKGLLQKVVNVSPGQALVTLDRVEFSGPGYQTVTREGIPVGSGVVRLPPVTVQKS